MTLRIDPALSYLSFPASVEALPADFNPEPGSDAAKLVAIHERLESEGDEDFERYNRAHELVEKAGLPPEYALSLYDGDLSFLRYTPAGVSPFSGTLEVRTLPGGYFATIDVADVVPSAVNGLDLDELLDFDSLQIREHEVRGDPGSICFCMIGVGSDSPTISASFDGRRLVIDYEKTLSFVLAYQLNAIWIGSPPPPELFAESGGSITYHLVASVVPLPSTLWLLAPVLGGLGLVRRRAA